MIFDIGFFKKHSLRMCRKVKSFLILRFEQVTFYAFSIIFSMFFVSSCFLEFVPKIHFEKVGAAAIATSGTSSHTSTTDTTSATTPISATHEVPYIKSALKSTTNGNQGVSNYDNLPGANNRFGYRGNNIARPASTGITARHQNDAARETIENFSESLPKGGGCLVSNCKFFLRL